MGQRLRQTRNGPLCRLDGGGYRLLFVPGIYLDFQMKNFVPYLLLTFIGWVIVSGNLPAYIQLIATSTWMCVSPSDLFSQIFSSGSSSSSSSGSGGEIGALEGAFGLGGGGSGGEGAIGTDAALLALA
jgi:uncharacterized membrane protein YgcG